MDDARVLVVPDFAAAAWLPELLLAGTVLLGLLAAGARTARLTRPVLLGGLAAAAIAAMLAWPAAPAQPLGVHLTVDATAGLVRLAVLLATFLTVLNLPRTDHRAAVMLSLAALGVIWLSEAATVGALLLAVAVYIVAAGLGAWFAAAPVDRGAVRRWYLTGTLGFALLAFGAVLWSGLAGTPDLAVSAREIARWPYLPPLALSALVACAGAGLAMALLGEPGRFAEVSRAAGDRAARGLRLRDHDRRVLAPAMTGWLTAVPPLGLCALLERSLRDLPPTRPLSDAAEMLVWAAGLLLIGGFLAALTRRDLERRLAWAAVGQVGLAMLGFAVVAGGGAGGVGGVGGVALSSLLVFAAAQIGALLLADLVTRLDAAGRRRQLLPFLMGGMLLALAALPPLAGWRPRLALLQALVAGDRYAAAALVLGGQLLACFVYLRPLVDLWRQDGGTTADAVRAEPAWPLAALLSAAALLAVLLAWGLGLLGLPQVSLQPMG